MQLRGLQLERVWGDRWRGCYCFIHTRLSHRKKYNFSWYIVTVKEAVKCAYSCFKNKKLSFALYNSTCWLGCWLAWLQEHFFQLPHYWMKLVLCVQWNWLNFWDLAQRDIVYHEPNNPGASKLTHHKKIGLGVNFENIIRRDDSSRVSRERGRKVNRNGRRGRGGRGRGVPNPFTANNSVSF